MDSATLTASSRLGIKMLIIIAVVGSTEERVAIVGIDTADIPCPVGAMEWISISGTAAAIRPVRCPGVFRTGRKITTDTSPTPGATVMTFPSRAKVRCADADSLTGS